MNKLSLSSVLVVEGKDDESKLLSIFDASIIKTNGSALTKKTLHLIEKLNKTKDVILVLDPDKEGLNISHRILKYIPGLKQVLLNPELGKGVAEQPISILRTKILELSEKNITPSSITWGEYLDLRLNTAQKREELSKQLKIPYFNHKQLFKKIKCLGLSLTTVKELMY